jgi:hypothetical protein
MFTPEHVPNFLKSLQQTRTQAVPSVFVVTVHFLYQPKVVSVLSSAILHRSAQLPSPHPKIYFIKAQGKR